LLLFVLTITTYLNLNRADKQAERVLSVQGASMVSGLAAGLRTGWRFWPWQQESLQGLIQEMSQGSDVAFIALLDDHGVVLAHSNPELIGRVLKDYGKIVSPLRTDRVVSWFLNKDLYLSGLRLRVTEFRGSGMMSWSGMMEHRSGMMRNRPGTLLTILKPRVILVGLKTDAYIAGKREQVQHALMMAGLLFIVTFGGIFFIVVLQNYRTIDRTLQNLSTYTSGIVENMPNGLITLDQNGAPVMINQTARKIFGWGQTKEEELADDPVIKSLAGEFLPRPAEGGSLIEREFTVSAGNGRSIPLAVSAAAAPAGGGEDQHMEMVLILRDLSPIRDLEEQVRQSEKMAAVGRLAAGVAHEVRNPLSSMRGLARFLARDMDENSREAEYLKVMVDEIDRLNRVMTGLLDFARPRQPNLERLDLNEAVRHTLGLITDDAKHQGVIVEESLSADPVIVMADRDQVTQAVLNVLLNGIEVMPDGGSLKVRTFRERDFAVVSVEDTGPGIQAEDHSRIFDPFYTTKHRGTGLGLALVSRIMEAHGGRVIVSGQPGCGAVFSLYWPVPEKKITEES